MHIARVGERLPRLQIQFRISRSFRPQNLANLGSKIRFWIRQKEHTLRLCMVCLCIFYKRFWLKNKSTILFTNHFYLG